MEKISQEIKEKCRDIFEVTQDTFEDTMPEELKTEYERMHPMHKADSEFLGLMKKLRMKGYHAIDCSQGCMEKDDIEKFEEGDGNISFTAPYATIIYSNEAMIHLCEYLHMCKYLYIKVSNALVNDEYMKIITIGVSISYYDTDSTNDLNTTIMKVNDKTIAIRKQFYDLVDAIPYNRGDE